MSIYVGDLTKLLNTILEGRNDRVKKLTARKVGALLRALNLVADRDAKGYGFLLLNDVRRGIHELARTLDAPGLRENVGRREDCAAVLGEGTQV
jgi:hypothetical protein